MNDRRLISLLLVGLIIILTALGIKWFFNNFERQDVENNTGYSTKARLNKFLAAEYYLRKLGFNVDSDSTRIRLLDDHNQFNTILMNDYGPKLSPTHFKELIAWIENGGHLIITPSDYKYSYSENDNQNIDYDFKNNQLLEKFGITPSYTNYDEFKNESDDNKCNDCSDDEYKAPVFKLNEQQDISIDFSSSTHLIDRNYNASFSLNSIYGNHLLQYDIKNGKLTVLSDNHILNNYNIGSHDHAYLLSLLINNDHSSDNKILLLYNVKSDSIFSLIWKYGKEACIAFLALLIISLWSMRNRIGPLLPNHSFTNRNITEHLRAIARFSWRQDHGIQLLSQSRMTLENTLLKRYPALKPMSTRERLQHISEILDIEPDHHTIYKNYGYFNERHINQ